MGVDGVSVGKRGALLIGFSGQCFALYPWLKNIVKASGGG